MNEADRKDISEAMANVAASASVGTMGVVAICNELVAAGLLDTTAIARVGAFMVASIEGSRASAPAKTQLAGLVGEHFEPFGPISASKDKKH